MAKYPLLDTSSFIQYRHLLTRRLTDKLRMSIVVFYELTATTISESDLQQLNKVRLELNKTERLVMPTMSDWWETAKMIRRLRFGQKRKSGGQTPKIQHAQTLQNDALIARSASLHDCFVITNNIDDFSLFLPFMPKLEIVSAEEFFGE